MEPRLKNLIILGAASGHDINRFLRKTPNSETWTIYGFEPSLDQFLHLEHRFRNYKNVHCVNAAATTFDGTARLYECRPFDHPPWERNHQNGRSINPLKGNVISQFKEVEAIDIAKWLKDSIQRDSFNIMVIDIEGAEYDVIDHLKENDMLSWIDELYIEFHGEKIKDFDMNRERSMADMLIDFYKENVYIENYYQSDKFSEMNSEVRRAMNEGKRD
jgi:FkbM family methyltransferase